MANQATGEQGFLANLGKVYGIYTGGFLAFIILVAILEQLGVPNRRVGLSVRRLHHPRLRHHRRAFAHRAGVGILCGGPQGSRLLQRHGHRR